jgi:hypothetical protein
MVTRYDPTSGMKQTPYGAYVTFAEHEELVKEVVETIGEYFTMVERGELSAADAAIALGVYVRMLGA